MVGDIKRGPAICPHCWMVNPGPFRLCARCGASMDTLLQESGGLRRTAAVQSPMPMVASGRLTRFQKAVIGVFVATLATAYLVQLVPHSWIAAPETRLPTSSEGSP